MVADRSKICFIILSFTWGGALSILGGVLGLLLNLRGYPPKRFGMFICYEIGQSWGGINFGPFIITHRNPSLHLLKHESGHGLQNAVYGIFMIPLIGIPSVVRASWRKYKIGLKNSTGKNLLAYESIWFEKQATKWGYEFYSNEKGF